MTTTEFRRVSTGRRAVVAGSAFALALGIAAAPVAVAQGSSDALPPLGGINGHALNASAPVPTTDGPTVTVSETTFSAEGEHEVTITGTGFNDDSVVGARPPLAGLNSGAYVVFGKFADHWQPSTGGGGRVIVDQRWALTEESADAPPLAGNPEVVVVDENGDFTTTLTVSKAAADTGSETGNYGIYTYAGGGVNHAPYETEQPITFIDEDDAAADTTGSLASVFGSIPNIVGS